MIVAAYQPYFAPFPGFFAKACLVDVLVLYDAVQFPNRTSWLTRNRFKGANSGRERAQRRRSRADPVYLPSR